MNNNTTANRKSTYFVFLWLFSRDRAVLWVVGVAFELGFDGAAVDAVL